MKTLREFLCGALLAAFLVALLAGLTWLGSAAQDEYDASYAGQHEPR